MRKAQKQKEGVGRRRELPARPDLVQPATGSGSERPEDGQCSGCSVFVVVCERRPRRELRRSEPARRRPTRPASPTHTLNGQKELAPSDDDHLCTLGFIVLV